LQWATLAFLNTSLVATLDEWHQTFLPSRTGTFRDVILDSSAGLVAQMAVFALIRMSSRVQYSSSESSESRYSEPKVHENDIGRTLSSLFPLTPFE